jgi:endoglucanase
VRFNKGVLFFLCVFSFSFANWEEFKLKFLKKEGNIIDPYNSYRTTSESQGYGLFLAVINNDKNTFNKILNWTYANLKRKDNLFAWHWNGGKIIDYNNALDGDFFIAYALILAFEKWKKKEYLKKSKDIINSSKELILTVCSKKKHYILIPARYGFIHEKEATITVFPSYYLPFIFKKFKNYDDFNFWEELYKYSYKIYQIPNITFNLKFSLFTKKWGKTNFVGLDTYRLIPYSYLDTPKQVKLLKKTFLSVNNFFQKNGYIPINFYYTKKAQAKQEAPYCVYKWFYFLYNDEKYINRYKKLKTLDKNNYFCEFFENVLEDYDGRL